MDLILHLGAHRTGSTSLSEALRINGAALGRDGVALWLSGRMRGMADFARVTRLARQSGRGDAKAQQRLSELAAQLGDDLRAEAVRGRSRVILSEENILGTMPENFAAAALYPDLAERLAAYAKVLPKPPARIGLGLRGYDTLWPSAYMFVLLRRSLPPFDAIRADLAWSVRGWIDVVNDIAAAFPKAEIRLWQQEGLDRVLMPVVAGLLGDADADRLVHVRKRANASPPGHDAELIHRLRQGDPTLAGAALLGRLAALRGAGPPGAAPAFDATETAMLRDRYAREVAALRGLSARVRLVDPPVGAAA